MSAAKTAPARARPRANSRRARSRCSVWGSERWRSSRETRGPNGSAVRPRESGFFLFYRSKNVTRDGKPLLEPGDSIVVPEKLDRIAWLREIKDITQILFQVAVSAGVVVALF